MSPRNLDQLADVEQGRVGDVVDPRQGPIAADDVVVSGDA